MGISRKQALDCLRSDDLIGIGMEADAVRRRLHTEGVVSYAVGGRVCCGGVGGAADSVEKVCEKVRETVEMGGRGVRLGGLAEGGGNARGVGEIEGLLRGVRARFPAIWLEGLTAGEVAAVRRESGLGVREMLVRLRDAGMDSIASDGVRVGEDAEAEWLKVQRAAHGVGMRTVAAMSFGADVGAGGVEMERLVAAMEAVRRLQEETGGFAAFVPRSFQPEGGGTGYGAEEPTAVGYLKVLAVSRMMLDNIENVEAGGAERGLKVLQTGLGFGANDAGWWMAEGNAAKGAGEEELRRVIRDAGFRPVERDAPYRTMFLG
jgi:cyclic dehypoxanthinyl futalosine synthase